MNKNISQNIKAIILGLIVVGGLSLVSADWTAPKASPTTCATGNPGCDAPINVSVTQQTKTGTFTVGGLGVLGSLSFLPTLSTVVTKGQVLMADDTGLATGKVKWGTPTGSQTIRWDKWVTVLGYDYWAFVECQPGWVVTQSGGAAQIGNDRTHLVTCTRVDPTYSNPAFKCFSGYAHTGAPQKTCSVQSTSANPYGA